MKERTSRSGSRKSHLTKLKKPLLSKNHSFSKINPSANRKFDFLARKHSTNLNMNININTHDKRRLRSTSKLLRMNKSGIITGTNAPNALFTRKHGSPKANKYGSPSGSTKNYKKISQELRRRNSRKKHKENRKSRNYLKDAMTELDRKKLAGLYFESRRLVPKGNMPKFSRDYHSGTLGLNTIQR